MAYRVMPLLGEYRRRPLLGADFSTLLNQFKVPIATSYPILQRLPAPNMPAISTTIGPAPVTPVSSPTVVVAPAVQPSVLTTTPSPLPVAPSVPTAPGSSPMAPAGGGGGGGGGSAFSPAAVGEGLPNWVIPAAGAGLLLMFLMRR